SEMVLEVESARRGPITGFINSDNELISAQGCRVGAGWCAPEDWGTWSKYPAASKLFYVPRNGTRPGRLHIYEKARVTPPMIGQILTISLNGRPIQRFKIDAYKFTMRIIAADLPQFGRLTRVELEYAFEETETRAQVLAELRKIDDRVLGLGFESMLIF